MSIAVSEFLRAPSFRLASLPLLAALDRRDRLLTATGLLLLLTMLPLWLAGLLDERTLHGVSVWDKPMKFAFALGVYTLTLAFFCGWIDERARSWRPLRIAIIAAVAAIAFEQVYITFQAARALPSHFNFSSPLYSIMYALMGIGSVILTAAAPAIGLAIHRAPTPSLPPALKSGAILGLILTLPLTLLTAGTMSAMGGHWIGGEETDAGGRALMGWVRDGGDLRVAHFFATHALHAIPLAAAFSAFAFGAQRRWPVRIFAALFVGFVLLVFVQALTGRPFLPSIG